MKKNYLTFWMAVMIVFTISATFPKNFNYPAFKGDVKPVKLNQDEIGKAGVYPGRIHVKFRENVGPFNLRGSAVVTSIPSLDDKIHRYEVDQLTKRFNHNPTPRNSLASGISRIHQVTFPDKYDPVTVAAVFSQDPNVEYAEPVYIYHMEEVPNDAMYDMLQHLPQIMAEQAWGIHKGENGTEEVMIAIVDGGTDWRHPDLVDNVRQNLMEDADGDGHTIEFTGGQWVLDPGDLNGIDNDWNGYVDDLIGWDFMEFEMTGDGSDPDPYATTGVTYYHGSHVAGLAAGVTNNSTGIASISWNVKYLPLQTDDGNNTILFGYDGILYAADRNADVINCSWGGYNNYSQVAAEVIAYAHSRGCIMVCSAGNANNTDEHYPSDYPGVVSVAALNVDDTKTSYSCFGPGVDVSAPGGGFEGGLLSTMPNNSYDLLSGTSMASPVTAGLMALVKSYHPDWTRQQVIEQVVATTDSIDTLNPGYENLLGSGRINAYHALADTNPVIQPNLRFRMVSYEIVDESGNGILEAGETAAISIRFRNHGIAASSDNVLFTLTTEDDDMLVLIDTAMITVPADDFFELTEAFIIMADEDASPHIAELNIGITADLPITWGAQHMVPLFVAPSGILVYDGEPGQINYSGEYIRNFLVDLGYEVLYTSYVPSSYEGFDAVFLSYGNYGQALTNGTILTYELSVPIQEYAEAGGKVYIETSGLFSGAGFYEYPNLPELMQLFGVWDFDIILANNPIDTLSGMEGTLCEGMRFTSSNQSLNWYIDNLEPAEYAACPFYENDYGNVSIYCTGEYGQKTFYFGYALAELVDMDAVSSRYNILLQVLNHFGYQQDSGYVIANLMADTYSGGVPLEVNFRDISLTDAGFTVNSWEWDFNNDGEVDSEEQNPLYTYDEMGVFDVRLVVSNGYLTDTIVKEDLIRVVDGIFVWEGIPGARDMSGEWIRDFLLENNYIVTYSADERDYSPGYDAVFLSFGNYNSNYMEFSDGFADKIYQYLNEGGNVYLEGGDALGFDQADNEELLNYFGLLEAIDGDDNAIDSLKGLSGSIAEGMGFSGSNQESSGYIDRYRTSQGTAVFVEIGYDTVAVQNAGDTGQKTFCFSYALAELEDGETTREEMMWSILNFFDIVTQLEEATVLPSSLFDIKVFPNPASDHANIRFHLQQSGWVDITLYDLVGRQVHQVANQNMTKGSHTLVIDTERLTEGIYLCRMVTAGEQITKKIIMTK